MKRLHKYICVWNISTCDLLLVIFHAITYLRYFVNMTINAEFEVCTEVVIKHFILWYIIRCSQLEINQCFIGTFHLYLYDWKVNQAWNHHETCSKQRIHTDCLAYPPTLKMVTAFSSEMLVDFQRGTTLYTKRQNSSWQLIFRFHKRWVVSGLLMSW